MLILHIAGTQPRSGERRRQTGRVDAIWRWHASCYSKLRARKIYLTGSNSWPTLTEVSSRRSMPGMPIRFERSLARLVCACVVHLGTDPAYTLCDSQLVSGHFCGTHGNFRGTSGELTCHNVPEKMCSPSTPRHPLCTDFSVYRFPAKPAQSPVPGTKRSSLL